MSKLWLELRLYYYKLRIKLGVKPKEIYYIGGSSPLPPPLSREEEYQMSFSHLMRFKIPSHYLNLFTMMVATQFT